MKKVFFLLSICSFILLTSCFFSSSKIKGIIPNVDFSVSEILNDRAVFKEDSKIIIRGVSEYGVAMNLEVINKAGKVVSSTQTLVSNSDGSFELVFESPKKSFESYTIGVFDSHYKFEHFYDDIRFGYVYMLLGDDIFDLDFDKKLYHRENFANISFFDATLDDARWLKLPDDMGNLKQVAYDFAYKMQVAYNAPVGVIALSDASTNIYEWLSKETIDDVSVISSMLQKLGKYESGTLEKGDMSYIASKHLQPLSKVSVNNIIWYQGVNELDCFENEEYSLVYFQMLYHLINNWRDLFGSFEFALVQAPTVDNEFVVTLRTIQNAISNYYPFIKVIPSYDLCFETDERLENIDILTTRLKNILKDHYEVSDFLKVLYNIDEEETVTSLSIIFDATDALFTPFENPLEIYGLKIYYQEETLKEIIIEPKIKNNTIVLSLEYFEKIINEQGEEEIVKKYYDKSKIIVEYGQQKDMTSCDIYNKYNLPLLPFKIDIK